MENSDVIYSGTIKFDVLENGNYKISILCSEFSYFQLLGLIEQAKNDLINDNKKGL